MSVHLLSEESSCSYIQTAEDQNEPTQIVKLMEIEIIKEYYFYFDEVLAETNTIIFEQLPDILLLFWQKKIA